MARQRKSNTETTNTRRGQMAFEPLDNEAIDEVLAGSRARGTYDAGLKEFMESEVRGARVPTDSGPYAGKKPASIKTGFTGAIGREGAPEGASNVRVVVKGEQVYLINDNVSA